MRFKMLLGVIVICLLIFLNVPYSSADSSAASWTRAYCQYNAGSGGYACDSGQVTGNSASCSAANGVNCATEGNVYCYATSSCEKHGSSSAGPRNAYNVNWDTDSADCSCKGATWFSNLGSSTGSTPWCCGDDGSSDDWATYSGSVGTSTSLNCRRCLNGADQGTVTRYGNGHLSGSTCYYGDITCSASSAANGASCTLGSNDICGNGVACQDCSPYARSSTTSCYTSCTSDSYCEPAAHCDGNTCYADLADGNVCNENSDCISGDCNPSASGTSYCTASGYECATTSGSGMQTGNLDCYNNDIYRCNSENNIGIYIDCASVSSTDSDGRYAYTTGGYVTDTNNACSGTSCTTTTRRDYCSGNTIYDYYATGASYGTDSRDCNYYDTCAGGQSLFRDYRCIDTTNDYCGYTDRDRDSASSYCTTSVGACDSQIWDSIYGACCGDDNNINDYFYTPNVGGCIPQATGTVYDTTNPIITDISASTSVDYYYNKTGATTGIVYFNSAIADGESITFTVDWTDANSNYGEDDLMATRVSGLNGGLGQSENVYPAPGTLGYTFNSADSNGTLDIYVRDAVWLKNTKPITFTEDTTLPDGTIVIDGGNSFTDNTRVNLTLTYSDNVGVRDCAYSNDNVEWTFWQSCSENKSWNLIDEDGRRYVYYKIRDMVGNTYVANNSIFLDRQKPTIEVNDDATHTNSIDTNLSFDFSTILGDAVNCSLMNDGESWTAWSACPTTPDPLYPEIEHWTLRSGVSGIRTVSMKVNTSFSVVKEANDTIIYDSQPPTGSIDIWAINVPGIQEANNHTTAYTTVTLRLEYDDNDAVAGCRFANDENQADNFTPWQTCETPKAWILNDEDGLRTVYYQIKDYAGNINETSNYIMIDKTGAGQDTTPPSAPVVIDDGVWTNNNTMLHATWSGAYDKESEILNIPLVYEYSINTSDGTPVVGWTSVGTDTEMTRTGLTLVDATTYFINVRVTNSASLTNQSSSDGITVDITPCQITSLSSSTHQNATWNNNSQSNNPKFNWTGDVGGSGVYGYSYVLDEYINTIPDTIPEGDFEDLPGETSVGYNNIIDAKLYFHVRCRDNAGNWGDEEDFEVRIDTSPPTTPQMREHEVITNQTNMTFNWTVSIEQYSGPVTYEFELYNNSVFNDTYLVNRTNRTSEHITIFNLISGVTYYPRVRAQNLAELYSSWSSEVSTEIDYHGPVINIITLGYDGDLCNVGSLSPIIRVETDESATCKFKKDPTSLEQYDFDYTGSQYHESRVGVNETSNHTFEIECWDAIGNNADETRAFYADPGIAVSMDSISPEPHYYIGFTTTINLTLNNKLGGISHSDFAVLIEDENLSSDEFGITDLGCGNYLLELEPPSDEGEYDIEIYAGDGPPESETLNMVSLNFSITYSGTLTDDDEKDQMAYAQSGNATVGIATDSPAVSLDTTEVNTINLISDPMQGSNYLFAAQSRSYVAAIDKQLEDKEFSEAINPNFGYEPQKIQYTTVIKLDYDYADIYSIISEQSGFEQIMPGKYSLLIRNTGTDPDTGNERIEIVVS